MGGSLNIAKIFGIPLRLHWTFFLLFFGLGALGWAQNGSLSYLLWSSLFLLAVFACVVLHEFGHALTARRYGVHTVDIILSPIGGIARLDRLPEKPWQEFAVAIAGPLVNVGIAVLLMPAIFLLQAENTSEFFTLVREGNLPAVNTVLSSFFLPSLFILNLTLALFNMLPAFPMDGGRIFRALLSIPLGRLRATRVASIVGQVFAGLMVVYGIWTYSIILAVIGVFIYLSAAQEYRSMKTEQTLAGELAGRIMQTSFQTLSPADLMQTAVELYRRGIHRNFLVVDDITNQPLGILPKVAITDAMQQEFPTGVVGSNIIPVLPAHPLSPTINLRDAYDLMRKNNRGLLVFSNPTGEIAGILELHQIRFFLDMQGSIKQKSRQP